MRTWKSRVHLCVTALLLLPALLATAQTASTTPRAADELLKAKRWQEAATAYEAIVKGAPGDAAAWFGLASARYALGDLRAAATAFEKNIAISNNPIAMFNLACVDARMNETDKAIEWLGRAVAPASKAYFILDLKDADLASLHDDPRYRAIVQSVDKLKNPCMYSAEARQFDFWIGEWDAFAPGGGRAGSSVIQRIANGCGILENWTEAAGGGSGKSINFYDPGRGKWFQYWIGQDGNPHRFEGTYQNGALAFQGEPRTVNGKTFLTRLTFFNVDAQTVRQLSEQSGDEGKTWSVVYDFKYLRRNAAKGGARDE